MANLEVIRERTIPDQPPPLTLVPTPSQDPVSEDAPRKTRAPRSDLERVAKRLKELETKERSLTMLLSILRLGAKIVGREVFVLVALGLGAALSFTALSGPSPEKLGAVALYSLFAVALVWARE